MNTSAKSADLSLTREFLANQAGVAGAEVWSSGTKILARVEVYEWSELSDTDLRGACYRTLGADLTPALVMLERTRGGRDVKTA